MKVPERHTEFSVSPVGARIGPPPLDTVSFRTKLLALGEDELPGFLRSYVRDRVPAAFLGRPMLWEAIRQWIAVRLHVDPLEIGLAGSAQVGFSCAPKKFGQDFSPDGSDLDLFVVSEAFYTQVATEILGFVSRPDHLDGGRYVEQKKTIQTTSQRGFVDFNQIPSEYERYPLCANVNNLASIIVDKLRKHQMQLRRSHFRVYKSWKEFSKQTLINFKNLRARIAVVN